MTEAELATQKMFTSLTEKITALDGKIEAIRTIVNDDHKTIHGNGQPGLVQRITSLETKVAVAAALAGLGGSLILELLKLFFK